MFPAVRIKPQKYEQNGGELEEYSSLQADLSEESHGSDDIASSGSPGRIEIDRGSDHGSLVSLRRAGQADTVRGLIMKRIQMSRQHQHHLIPLQLSPSAH